MTSAQKNWAARVKALRHRLGADGRPLACEKLAALVGVSASTVIAWERGWWEPRTETQRRIEELESQ